ncbi:MAG: leucine-rich repeat protein [Bacteroidaceae bacterium]|nr:leucine-rich repeat protein [Bacteroidaceae bacterium]
MGGRSNTKTHLQERIDGNLTDEGNESSQTVENGRTYHITIAVNNGNVKCYLDGELIHDYDFTVLNLKGTLNNAFERCSGLTNVSIPEGVTSIGNYAFYGCFSLTSVTIPNSVTSIGDNAFDRCSSLTSITIPNSVTTINREAFYGCSSLTSITIPEGVTSIDEWTFGECKSLTSITIPNSVTSILIGAFYGCSGLTSVTIPNSVTSIGEYAFDHCGLTSVTIPSSVRILRYNAFAFCASLKRVFFEEGTTLGDNNTFAECPSLEEVIFPSTLCEGNMFDTFGGTPKLTHVVMPIDAPRCRYAELCNGRDISHSVLFTIPEGSARNYLEKGYYNISDNSALAWMKEEFEDETASVEGLMTAEGITADVGAKTALQTAIASARSAVLSADSYLAISAQIEAVKTAAKAYISSAVVASGTDVTALVRNPQMNRMDLGWDFQYTTTWQGCRVGYNNTGVYSEGDSSVNRFIETWWNGVTLLDGNFSQTLKQLPAGIYRLEADVIASWQQDENVEVTGASLFAGNSSTAISTDDKPEHLSVTFTIYSQQDVAIGIRTNSTNANWVAMDNVRLYFDGSAHDAAYASADINGYLSRMGGVLDLTNVYTPEAYATWYTSVQEAFDNGSIADDVVRLLFLRMSPLLAFRHLVVLVCIS